MSADTLHILLIDDDDVDREAVRRLLEPGWVLHEAPTARAAMDIIGARSVDCVLLDYRLPDADGLAALPELVGAGLPVVMLTGQGNDDVAVASMRLGAHYYLEKDAISRSTLIRAVRVALEMAALRISLALKNDQLMERTREAERRATQLRSFARALTTAEQAARRRLADSLHNHLQQLLTAAIVRLGRARRRVTGDNAQPVLEAIEAVEELLHSSIDETRNLTIELSPPILRHSGLAAALEWLAQWMREKHELTVRTEVRAGIDPEIPELRTFLFEAVRELLFNVVKHAEVAEARLSLRLDDSGSKVVLSVQDEGAGCDPVVLDRKRQKCESFGIFSIAERIEIFGGHCRFETAEGGGFTATLVAPLQVSADESNGQEASRPAPASQVAAAGGDRRLSKGASEAAARGGVNERSRPQPVGDSAIAAMGEGNVPKAAAAGAASAAGANGSLDLASEGHARIRVLLADDHRIVRQGLVSLLEEQEDLEVVAEADDGLEAVELARQCRPDAVVLDVNMPRMNGIEACRIISQELPETQVIGLSVNNDDATAQAMFDAGAITYLKKDGPAEVLWAAIRRAAAITRSA